jgi:DNA replication protein DnaC
MGRLYLALAREAAERNQTHVDYLAALTEQEIVGREENSLRRRLKAARFPLTKTLADFDFAAIPSLNKNKVLLLSQCEFIRQKENGILPGNSGIGKTHLAIAFGICACRQGLRVRFFTASELAMSSSRRNKSIASVNWRSPGSATT